MYESVSLSCKVAKAEDIRGSMEGQQEVHSLSVEWEWFCYTSVCIPGCLSARSMYKVCAHAVGWCENIKKSLSSCGGVLKVAYGQYESNGYIFILNR